jgi:regulation of enolase protein 1 (concanavalin A-like superfamily)
MMIVSSAKGLAFQRRRAPGGLTFHTGGAAATAPYWVRLERTGSRIRAFQSADGKAWTLVGTDTIALDQAVYVGLAMTSHVPSRAGKAVFSDVRVTVPVVVPPPPPPPSTALPAGWSSVDVGSVGAAGAATYDGASGTFAVRGAGADVWGSADALHYAYTPVTGDGRIVARVTSVQQVHAWTKAGVMIRATTAPGSMHGFMLVSGGNGSAFQRRPTTNGSSLHTSGVGTSPPWWVRLDRIGNTLKAYESADGETWSLVATQTTALPPTILVGLGVGSHVRGTVADARFDRVSVSSLGSR